MRHRTKPAVIAIALLCAGGIVALLWIDREGGGRFSRLEANALPRDGKHFTVSEEHRRLLFTKDGRGEILEEIPTIDGGYFFLRDRRRVRITPTRRGKLGLYTYLFMRGEPASQDIEFRLEIERRGKVLEVRRIRAPKTSYALFADLDLRRGDRIVMNFSGRGIVFFSRPILYEKPAAGSGGTRNVILVAADTFRGDQLGATVPGVGSLTPGLDRFSRDAVRLDNALAPTSWTLPSFMSMFTGLNEYNHGVGIKTPLPPGVASLVEALSARFVTFGYHGGMVMNGKWGFSRGFDFYKELPQATPLYPRGGESLFRKAVETLRQARFPDFFLFLHTYQLHSPYTPPGEFLRRLDPAPRHARLDAVNYNLPAKTYLPVDDEHRRTLKKLYQAEILAFDRFFGDFMDGLRKLKIYDSSLIIFMSDHGEEFFEHGGWAHAHSLYDELIRVPLLIKFPHGRHRGKRIGAAVGIVDILPTLLSYCGIAYDTGRLDGRDLLPLIRGRVDGTERTIVSTISTGKYFEHFPGRIALVRGRYKLVYNEPYTASGLAVFSEFAAPPQPGRFELFDLESDPGETRNIAVLQPRVRAEMLPLLRRLRLQIVRSGGGSPSRSMDEEARKHLEALGYI
ncbi:MAG: sulfatase-like hydrolase/transferase [Candidatus Aminicenantes bacterium]|nr:sulfatase-like hydrolase/transferase [Candidatus Aminicenantes bacterium]